MTFSHRAFLEAGVGGRGGLERSHLEPVCHRWDWHFDSKPAGTGNRIRGDLPAKGRITLAKLLAQVDVKSPHCPCNLRRPRG